MTDSKLLVCVVDDEEALRTMLCGKLNDAGFATVQAANGLEALEVMARSDVAVMVMDIIMPEHEGLSTISQMKERNSGMPILAISGGGSGDAQDYLLLAQDLGADEILAKPFRGDKFVACVKRLAALRNRVG